MALSKCLQVTRRLPLAQLATGSRGVATGVSLPDLPYDYSDLEPAISAEIMQLHHSKHHQTYINNLVAALERHKEAEMRGDLATQISLHNAIKFNGGGHVNHSIFWTNLCPAKDFELPSGELAAAIDANFGSLADFQTKFSAQTAAVQGSGWGWLGYSKATGKLVIETTSNQDPLSTKGLVPLLGVDVWEHAYYLQYKNVRPDYLKAIWQVVNWKNVAQRHASAKL